MTRPAVVIGVGGTGQWILTYLKKDLLELNGGVMPPNVRLIAFDTVSQAEAQKQVTGGIYSGEQAMYEKAAKRIGTVELERDVELIHIGGDCYPLGQEIARGEHPHLNWFDVDYWMNKAGLGRDNWILDRGAGRFRQFGLLAVYKDILGGQVRSQILKKLPTVINEVLAKSDRGASFEVIVVGSVAGGTGSAMMIPFGVLARKMCGDIPVRTRAIVVLPTAFSPGRPSAELELRGGAALRELARAMMPPEGYASNMTFLPGHREYESVAYSRPFDGIYFIDGERGGQPINTDPKYGVFPAASAWVRQILDDQSGAWFTNFVATNRAGAQANDPRRLAEGVFGVFGVHSFYTPERTLRQTYRLKLTDRVLRELTDARPEGPGGRLVANAQPHGAPESSALALTFLSQTAIFGGEQMPVTQFLNEIGRIVLVGGATAAPEVQKKAEAGYGARRKAEREADSWLAPLTTLPAAGKYDELRQDVARELGAAFEMRFKPSDASSPPRDPAGNAAFVDFTTNIEGFMHDHLGGMGADGPDDYGSFGAIARRCAAEQVGIFRGILRLQVLNLLFENQRRGRIGYAIRVLAALDKHFEDFQEFMKAVEKTRGHSAPRVTLAKEAQAKKAAWLRDRTNKPGCVRGLVQRGPAPEVLQAERGHLAAQLNLFNYVREECLHNAVKAAVTSMRSYCTETRRELERWTTTLLEGDKALDMNGLLSSIQGDLDRIVTNIREDQRSEQVERLVQVASRESQVSDSDMEWALEGVQWDAVDQGNGLALTLNLSPQGVASGALSAVRDGLTPAARRQIEYQNVATLERVCEQRFGQEDKVTPILVWCENHESYQNANTLATVLTDLTQPLTSLVSSAQPGMEAFSVSVNREVDPRDYAGRLEKEVRKKLTGGENPDNNYPVQVIGCEDPYRLTAVRTQVGLKLDEFQTWQTCRTAYESELKKADDATPDRLKELIRVLQSQYTQREEKAAIELEAKWRSEGQAHRVLNARMVSLVGKQRELQLALQCFALGWVREVPDKQFPDRCHWELQVPGWEYEFWLTPNKQSGALGTFEALEAFVLVNRNHARGREGAELRWKDLNTALLKQREAKDGESSPLKQAVQAATSDDGITNQWMERAERMIDPHTDKETFRNPVYRDLADYAAYYFKGAAW